MSIDGTHAQRVRRLEGRRRRHGAGVRPLLRAEDGLLPRRVPDRTRPLRRRAPRLPVLSREVRRHRPALHGVRLQGQAGPRQHSLLRSGAARSGISSRRRGSGEVYNIGGGPAVELLHARSDRHRRAADRAADAVDLQRHEPRRRPHLVGQRYPAVLRPLSRLGPDLLARADDRRRSTARWPSAQPSRESR